VIVEVLDYAEQDLRAGIHFYQRRERWLGEYFFDTLCADIEALALLAGIHHRAGRYYRSLSKRFSGLRDLSALCGKKIEIERRLLVSISVN